MNDTVAPLDPAERISCIDIVRGIALYGVMAINLLTAFRESLFQQFVPYVPPRHLADRATESFAHFALDMKAFSLFSFLFGVGLAIQYERLSRRGAPLYWLVRRLAALLAFGLGHLLCIWNGDILTEYAVAGFVVLPLLAAPRWALGAVAAVCLTFYAMIPLLHLPNGWPDGSWLASHVASANLAYGHGGFMAEHRFSFQEVAYIVPLHLFVLPRTVGLLVLGVMTWRAGLFKSPDEHCASIGVLAVVLMSLGLSLTHADGPVTGQMGPGILALGYCATLVWLATFTPVGILLRVFAPLGRMAFSNYIAESVVFSVVFYGFGLGLYGRIGAAATLLLGSTVYALQVLASCWWLKHYRFGPLEWLWRSLMYGTRQVMAAGRSRITAAQQPANLQ